MSMPSTLDRWRLDELVDIAARTGNMNSLNSLAGDIGNGMTGAALMEAWKLKQHSIEHDPNAARFTFHTAEQFDLLDIHRVYHVDGVLTAGPVPTVLAGSFKTLKTSIAADLMFSLATGVRFLNHFPIRTPVNVAMMSGESGGHALQVLLRRIAASRGWSPAEVGERFYICSEVLNLASDRDIGHVEKFIVENDIRVFIVDPTYLALRSLRGDEAGSLFAMGAFLEPFARLGERTGCTPILVHHNSRGATRANLGKPAELADIAWSGFAEWAGQWILLSRRDRYDPNSDGEHRLWLTAGGRDGHSTLVGVNVTEGRHDDPGGRRWDVEVEQATSARRSAAAAKHERRDRDRQALQQEQAARDRERVLSVLRELPEGESKTAIRDRTKLRNERFNPVFADMLSEGVITTCAITKGNNRTYEGFKLHRDAPGRNGTHGAMNHRPGAAASETDAPPTRGAS